MPDWFPIIFLAVFGACVGSFLNVVIYRLPRGLSLVHPGSHCPGCNQAIRWYDNIPVLSYLALGGKCRFCKVSISPRYALIESVTAVLFVGLYDAFYMSRIDGLFGDPQMDWPLFLAHLTLIAVLVVISALDLEYYLIDVRITYFAILVGIVAWVFLPGLRIVEREGLSGLTLGLYGGVYGAAVGMILRHLWLSRQAENISDSQSDLEDSILDDESPAAPVGRVWVAALVIFALGSLGLVIWPIMGAGTREDYQLRGLMYVVWAFLAIVAGGIPRRQSDQEIVEIIEQEKPAARKTAGRELAGLLPVILGFIGGFILLRYVPGLQATGQALYYRPVGPFVPGIGLTWALTGLLTAAAFGWVIRIGFTLLFGKEAMGTGDIYILGAIGTITGPAVAIVGFFIGSVIGVFGIVVLLLWKTSRALSYGPWIAIGTLVCLLFHDPIMNYLGPVAAVVKQLLLEK
jgi:leader peptidase (prepilin peptidase) / N-methyltransferase